MHADEELHGTGSHAEILISRVAVGARIYHVAELHKLNPEWSVSLIRRSSTVSIVQIWSNQLIPWMQPQAVQLQEQGMRSPG